MRRLAVKKRRWLRHAVSARVRVGRSRSHFSYTSASAMVSPFTRNRCVSLFHYETVARGRARISRYNNRQQPKVSGAIFCARKTQRREREDKRSVCMCVFSPGFLIHTHVRESIKSRRCTFRGETRIVSREKKVSARLCCTRLRVCFCRGFNMGKKF